MLCADRNTDTQTNRRTEKWPQVQCASTTCRKGKVAKNPIEVCWSNLEAKFYSVQLRSYKKIRRRLLVANVAWENLGSGSKSTELHLHAPDFMVLKNIIDEIMVGECKIVQKLQRSENKIITGNFCKESTPKLAPPLVSS